MNWNILLCPALYAIVVSCVLHILSANEYNAAHDDESTHYTRNEKYLDFNLRKRHLDA